MCPRVDLQVFAEKPEALCTEIVLQVGLANGTALVGVALLLLATHWPATCLEAHGCAHMAGCASALAEIWRVAIRSARVYQCACSCSFALIPVCLLLVPLPAGQRAQGVLPLPGAGHARWGGRAAESSATAARLKKGNRTPLGVD